MREVLLSWSTYMYSYTLHSVDHSDNAMYAFIACR